MAITQRRDIACGNMRFKGILVQAALPVVPTRTIEYGAEGARSCPMPPRQGPGDAEGIALLGEGAIPYPGIPIFVRRPVNPSDMTAAEIGIELRRIVRQTNRRSHHTAGTGRQPTYGRRDRADQSDTQALLGHSRSRLHELASARRTRRRRSLEKRRSRRAPARAGVRSDLDPASSLPASTVGSRKRMAISFSQKARSPIARL